MLSRLVPHFRTEERSLVVLRNNLCCVVTHDVRKRVDPKDWCVVNMSYLAFLGFKFNVKIKKGT